jgi:hypothetical protein
VLTFFFCSLLSSSPSLSLSPLAPSINVDPVIAQGSLVILSIAFTGLMAAMRVFAIELGPFLNEFHETSMSKFGYFLAKHLVELESLITEHNLTIFY